MVTKQAETKEFQAETKQLLDLMINSIYTNQEIFLRELIANASDAIDKIKFESLTDVDILEGDSDFEVLIDVDEENKTLTISDNGIGMTYDEVINNIGTIAQSGTKKFIEQLKDNKEDVSLIGQFGVGFYSAFMVAEKVTLITRASHQEKGVKWESEGDGTYTVEYTDKEQRGTEITLTLREEFSDSADFENDFTNRNNIKNLVEKYSNYVKYPIKMDFYHEQENEDGEKSVEVETKTLNTMTPLWNRNKDEISDEEYNEFYKNLSKDWNEPLEVIHKQVEGLVKFNALLYIPTKAPYDFYTADFDKGIKLYSKSVFIMDDCQEILPEYLKFVRGLVDSPDFSLNISREVLQHSKQLKVIGKNLEKTILRTLKSMLKKDREKYEGFWKEFGRAIKGGIYTDYSNKDKLENLLIFESSHSKEGMTTLAEYLDRISEDQEVIYYVTGESREKVENLPQMELLQDKGLEVIYCVDPIDEFVIDILGEYQDVKFKSVLRGDLELDDEEQEEESEVKEELLEVIKEHLKGKVDDVRLSKRLKSSAVCLVSDEAGMSMSMERILQGMNQNLGKARRILEINPDHQVFSTIERLYEQDAESETLKEYSELLYSLSSLVEGFNPDNPVEFANKISDLMAKAY
ncbi:molecular chaperone HtpG [Orenia metallireducens]|uniref:Chaperone protein HtpG n=1 Tax=Orenia metallireducens TaxID=1413210 RepID=A0A285HNN6_9FIRM|nr:molecular chaperone HtpG [Orenia metallireducens]PRX28004.1 molecular chaperone HtpG [Orenia metallireducens]SNY37335.1 molecular chaperone HtpG [Orenia metallireducens]